MCYATPCSRRFDKVSVHANELASHDNNVLWLMTTIAKPETSSGGRFIQPTLLSMHYSSMMLTFHTHKPVQIVGSFDRWEAVRLKGVGKRLAVQAKTCTAPKPAVRCKAVAEAAKETQQSPNPVQEGSWHAVIASADFMLHDVQNESFAEQLRERRRLFNEKGKPLDFWLVAEPAWLDESFAEKSKKVKRPSVALISTDEIWINFMKLRLDRVLRLELGNYSLEDVTKSNGKLPKYQPLDRETQWTAPYPPYRPGWWEVFMRQ